MFASWRWDPECWRQDQGQDLTLLQVCGYLEQGALPDATQRLLLSEPVKTMLKRLELLEGVLCRKVQDSSTLETLKQVLVPESTIQTLLETCHKHAGHPGADRMLPLLRRNFYWPKMEQVVQTSVQSCPCSVLHKAKANAKAPLIPLTAKAPMHILAMDFLTLSRPTDRYQNILVITDLFTKYAWATPTLDQTAVTTACALWTNVIQPFGCPETLHSD